MKANDNEILIVLALQRCSFQPGSFDKSLPKLIDLNNVSPKQQYWIYKLGYKYRKQIGNDYLELVCKNYLNSHSEPLSRKESQKIIRNCK